LLLALFAAGQGVLAFHYHAANLTRAGRPEIKRSIADLGACRTCELVSQSRSSAASVPAIHGQPVSVQALQAVAESFATSHDRVVGSARAPPAC